VTELGRWPISVIWSRSGGMSRSYSPRSETALALFIPLRHPHLLQELWDTVVVRRRANGIDIVSTASRKAEGSRLHKHFLLVLIICRLSRSIDGFIRSPLVRRKRSAYNVGSRSCLVQQLISGYAIRHVVSTWYERSQAHAHLTPSEYPCHTP
jgi:hypothetical protein